MAPTKQGESSKTLRMLARREPLSDAEWIELIQERAALLKPHFKAATLPRLGATIKCCGPVDATGPTMTLDEMDSGNWSGTRDLQGIWGTSAPDSLWPPRRESPVLTRGESRWLDELYCWGLDRAGYWRWVVVIRKYAYRADINQLCIALSAVRLEVPGRLGQAADHLKTFVAAGISLASIYDRLGQELRLLVSRRQQQLEALQRVELILDEQDNVLRAMEQ